MEYNTAVNRRMKKLLTDMGWFLEDIIKWKMQSTKSV